MNHSICSTHVQDVAITAIQFSQIHVLVLDTPSSHTLVFTLLQYLAVYSVAVVKSALHICH